MDVNSQEKVCTVPISLIDDFADHPFQVRDDEDMERLIQSIDNNGVLNPVILRKNGERYELIAGHRRKHACLRLGISGIPAIVRELSRDEAVVEMVDSNLQREHILPSEKAYAYKMKMDAMKRKAGRPKENSTPMVSNLRTDEIIGEESGESREQVRRYIRLTGSLLVWILSFIMILTVYGRFFKLYIYVAIAPVPMSAFAGEETSHIGKAFLKSFAAVCLEGAIIVLACIIYSLFAASPPSVAASASAVTQVWTYIGELLFNMLVLVGTIKLSDRVVREMMGL